MIADGMSVADANGVEGLVARAAAGDVRAVARACSVVEDGGVEVGAILAECARLPTAGRALRVGMTGAAGAGKSTLVDAMTRWLRAQGTRVGVVAVDPTSPYSGGALLGDRIRLRGFEGDAGVMVRSMASRGGTGGVAGGMDGVARVMEAAGMDWVLMETVGVGQDEVAIGGLVDVTVLVLTPGMGDDVQSLKAGVMEAADVYVVNKADVPGAERVVAEVGAMQEVGRLTGAEREAAVVVKTVGLTGEGVEELVSAVFAAKNDRSRRLPVVAGSAEVEVDHLGVAVRSLEAARGFWEGLGLQVEREEVVEYEGVKVAMLPLGRARVELLEGLGAESVIGRFVAQRGEGLHHVALRVKGLDARFAAMQAAGTRLASDGVRVGAGGHRYFFVHPASTGGVLVELVEDAE